jgi:hypothetical protein
MRQRLSTPAGCEAKTSLKPLIFFDISGLLKGHLLALTGTVPVGK